MSISQGKWHLQGKSAFGNDRYTATSVSKSGDSSKKF